MSVTKTAPWGHPIVDGAEAESLEAALGTLTGADGDPIKCADVGYPVTLTVHANGTLGSRSRAVCIMPPAPPAPTPETEESDS